MYPAIYARLARWKNVLVTHPYRSDIASALFVGALVGTALVGASPAHAVAQDIRITLGPGDGRISIAAPGVTRAQLLELLRTKYHIEVRPYDAPSDRITVNLVNQPIDSAIAAIMPRGSRYIVRLGERDVAATVVGGEKKGVPESRPTGLTPKKESPPFPAVGPQFKPTPERVRERPFREGRGLKPVPDSSQKIPQGRGPKVARNGGAGPDSTVRFSFTIHAPDTIRVVRATVIEGGTDESRLVRGPFLFALRGATGDLVFFGALVDPLEEHSYETNGRHGQTRAREGIFGISVPSKLVTEARLATLRLEFYDARGISLPDTLDARSFEGVVTQAKALARLEGRALLSILQTGPR